MLSDERQERKSAQKKTNKSSLQNYKITTSTDTSNPSTSEKMMDLRFKENDNLDINSDEEQKMKKKSVKFDV